MKPATILLADDEALLLLDYDSEIAGVVTDIRFLDFPTVGASHVLPVRLILICRSSTSPDMALSSGPQGVSRTASCSKSPSLSHNW